MKPSERRALKKQKDGERRDGPNNKPKRKQSLWQTYPKLITFIICMLVILVLFNIRTVSEAIEKKRTQVEGKADISLKVVYILSDMCVEVDWIHFEKYSYTDISYEINGKKYIKREYPVGDTGYIIWVGGESLEKSPDYVYLIDFEGTGEVIDIRKKDAEAFVNETMKQREDN